MTASLGTPAAPTRSLTPAFGAAVTAFEAAVDFLRATNAHPTAVSGRNSAAFALALSAPGRAHLAALDLTDFGTEGDTGSRIRRDVLTAGETKEQKLAAWEREHGIGTSAAPTTVEEARRLLPAGVKVLVAHLEVWPAPGADPQMVRIQNAVRMTTSTPTGQLHNIEWAEKTVKTDAAGFVVVAHRHGNPLVAFRIA